MTSAPARKTFQFDLHSKRQNIHLKKTCNMKTGKVGLMFPSLKKKKKKDLSFIWEGERSHTRGWGEGQKESENLKKTRPWTQSLIKGSISGPWDQDVGQNQELDASPIVPRCSLGIGIFWPELCPFSHQRVCVIWTIVSIKSKLKPS